MFIFLYYETEFHYEIKNFHPRGTHQQALSNPNRVDTINYKYTMMVVVAVIINFIKEIIIIANFHLHCIHNLTLNTIWSQYNHFEKLCNLNPPYKLRIKVFFFFFLHRITQDKEFNNKDICNRKEEGVKTLWG